MSRRHCQCADVCSPCEQAAEPEPADEWDHAVAEDRETRWREGSL